MKRVAFVLDNVFGAEAIVVCDVTGQTVFFVHARDAQSFMPLAMGWPDMADHLTESAVDVGDDAEAVVEDFKIRMGKAARKAARLLR